MARGRSAMFQLPPPTPSRLPRVCACFTRAGSSCLWGGGAALKLAGRARRAALVIAGLSLVKEHYTGGRLISFGARPAVVRFASCHFQRQSGCRLCSKRTRAGARRLWRGGADLELSARAPRCAGCGLLRTFRGVLHGRGVYLLRRVAAARRPAAASNAKPAAALEASAHVLALAVSGEVAQHSSLWGARAAPRWFWWT